MESPKPNHWSRVFAALLIFLIGMFAMFMCYLLYPSQPVPFNNQLTPVEPIYSKHNIESIKVLTSNSIAVSFLGYLRFLNIDTNNSSSYKYLACDATKVEDGFEHFTLITTCANITFHANHYRDKRAIEMCKLKHESNNDNNMIKQKDRSPSLFVSRFLIKVPNDNDKSKNRNGFECLVVVSDCMSYNSYKCDQMVKYSCHNHNDNDEIEDSFDGFAEEDNSEFSDGDDSLKDQVRKTRRKKSTKSSIIHLVIKYLQFETERPISAKKDEFINKNISMCHHD